MDASALAGVEALLRRAVLRVAPGAERPAAAAAGVRPWFAGTQELLDAVTSLVAGRSLLAAGFGQRWPALEVGGHVLAPGLPIAAGSSQREGPEAEYWRDGDDVWRAAAGRSERVLSLGANAEAPGCAIDLLWFGDGERCALAGRALTVDDRFSRLRVPVDPARLERELIRRLRVDPSVLSGLPTQLGSRPARIEVRRAASLLPAAALDDPARVLAAREGVEGAEMRGDRLLLRLAGSEDAELRVSYGPGGWRAERHRGEWPYLALELACEGADITYAAEIDPRIDPLRPGLRTRLAFDLGSDLVVLGG